jgi:hypothetical protein
MTGFTQLNDSGVVFAQAIGKKSSKWGLFGDVWLKMRGTKIKKPGGLACPPGSQVTV